MAKISGNAGTVKFNSAEIKVTNWKLDVKTETIDTTDSGDSTWKTFLPKGWKEWSGTFEGFQETGTADPAIGTVAAAVLAMSGTYVSPTVYYSGSIIITSIGTTTAVTGTDAVKKSFAFQGTGAVTLTNP